MRSRLEYASEVWSPYTKRNFTSLEQIQPRATRSILGKEYSERERLSILNLLPLQYIVGKVMTLYSLLNVLRICIIKIVWTRYRLERATSL